MLSKNAIKKYFTKKTDNWDWTKQIPTEIIETEIKEIFGEIPVKTKLLPHQLVCLLLGHYNKNFLYFVDMGLGKTLITLTLLAIRKKQGCFKRALVLVPYEVSMDSWEREVEKHSNLSILKLVGINSEERLQKMRLATEDLVVVPYPSLTSMFAEKSNKQHRIKKNRKWTVDYKLLLEYTPLFDTLILDESHLAKSFNTLIFSILERFSITSKYRYALTGTPFGRDAQDLWSQFYLIDRGETLGENITLFRESFFTSIRNRWGGYEYKLQPKLEKLLHLRIKHKSIRYAEDEINYLQGKTDIKIEVSLNKEAQKYYTQLLYGVIELDKISEKVGGIFYKMRGVTSGYLSFIDDVGEKETIFFKYNPKLEALQELILNIPDKKVVIFYEYTLSGDIICKKLNELKIEHSRLYSDTKNKPAVIKNFLHNKKCRIFVVNSKSGALNLNLQEVCHHQIYFESPVSPIVRKQSEKRCYRTGQKHHVFLYDIIVKNTIDEKILTFLSQGEDLFQCLLKDSKILLK